MIKYFTYLFLFCFISISCEKKIMVYEKGNQEFGYANGKISGQDWEASAFLSYNRFDSSFIGVNMSNYNTLGILRHTYSIGSFPSEIGFFEPDPNCTSDFDFCMVGSASRWGSDGDAREAAYDLDLSKENFVEVMNISESNDEITVKGMLQAHYKFRDGPEELDYSIELKDVEFEATFFQ